MSKTKSFLYIYFRYINFQNSVLRLKSNSPFSNINKILSKSSELQKRVFDCSDEKANLSFYNPYNKKKNEVPEVLPYKFFRQKRFLKISQNAYLKLSRDIDRTQEKIIQTKNKLLQYDDPSQIPFFIKYKKRRSQIAIPKNLSPLPSNIPSPVFRNRAESPAFLGHKPVDVVKIFKENKKRKLSECNLGRLKREGLLKVEVNKKKESLDESPFYALMWRRIKNIRQNQEDFQGKFERNLLRMAFDRKDQLIQLVQISFLMIFIKIY